MTLHQFKKALLCKAFFITCFLLLGSLASSYSLAASEQCPRFKATETARVAKVYDGDTVQLQDGRKIRFIGIDTPELAKNKKQRYTPSQPFAEAAKNHLITLFDKHGWQLQLMPDKEATDKYGRYLFYLQLSNGLNLQQQLLKQGLAVAYTTPPNQLFADCYIASEQAARNNKVGIWQHAKYQIIDVLDLGDSHRGFHLIKGKITHIGKSKKALWLNFNRRVSVRIDKRDLKNFAQGTDLYSGKTIIVRGWLRQYKNKIQVSARHPSAIEVH